MAEPTFDEATAKFSAAVNVLQKLRLSTNSNSPNTVALLRTYEETSKASGIPAAQASGAAQQVRSAIESILASPSSLLNPLLTLIARSSAVGSTATDPQSMIDDVVLYMANNSKRVASRVFSSGAFAAGSPYHGTDGQWERVTIDAYGLPLEARWPEVVSHKCVRDANIGVGGKAPQAGQELWSLKGLPFAGVAEWGVSGRGSGLDTTTSSVNGDDSLLANASFAARGGSDSVPTALTGWTVTPAVVGDGTDVTIDRTNYFQESAKENKSPAALNLKVTKTIAQTVKSITKGVKIDRPYYCGVHVNGLVGAAIGALVLTMGSKTTTTYVNGAKLVATVGGAGNVDAGAHDYLFTFVIGGVEYCSVVSASITAAGGGSTVALTAIAVGPAGTTARKVYRKTIGGTYKLLTTIADNTTTTYSDNTADSGLGATLGVTATTGYALVKLPDGGGTAADLWPQNWNQQGANIQLAWTRTAGSLLVDRFMFLPYTPIVSQNQPGSRVMSFLLRVSGATPDLYNDVGTTTDTETGSVIQDWWHRTWGRCAPAATGGSITWADPT